jgi:hypothetical protein
LKSFRNNVAKRNNGLIKVWVGDNGPPSGEVVDNEVTYAISRGWNKWSYPDKYDRLVQRDDNAD